MENDKNDAYRLKELTYKEMEYKVSSLNVGETEGKPNMQEYKIVLYEKDSTNQSGKNLGVEVYMKGKNDQSVMLEFARNFLKVGLEDMMTDPQKNSQAISNLLQEFVSENTLLEIRKLSDKDGSITDKAAYSAMNREYAKLGGIIAFTSRKH